MLNFLIFGPVAGLNKEEKNDCHSLPLLGLHMLS